MNDTIAEVETVKAAVELPSPFAGVVTALHAEEGETVPVGTPIISIDVGGATATDVPADAAVEDLVPGLPGEGSVPAEEKQLTLVGYGPREETGRRRRRRPPTAASAAAHVSFNLPPEPAGPAPDVEEPAPEPAARVLAKPPVRKLAKSLGVDLAVVRPTGPNGTVSREDVQSAADQWSVSGNGGQSQPSTVEPN